MSSEKLKDLQDIKNLMERSSRFLSLSGLSGISAGIIALLGAAYAFFLLDYDIRYFDINRYFNENRYLVFPKEITYLMLDASVVLILALASAIFFSVRKARKKGLKIWDRTTKRLLINLFIPLITGGIFCLLLTYYGIIFLVAPLTLIFYGLALLNAGKYTLEEIRWLGISEIVLGLVATVFVGYGIWFWAAGFGLLHIIYGIAMYVKYEH